MSLQDELELPKRKKAAVKEKAKPVADRHQVAASHPGSYSIDEWLESSPDDELLELHTRVTALVASRRQARLDKLQAEAAALGAKVSMPGKGSRKGEAAPVKYRDEHGNTWAGRGLKPKWLRERIDAGMSLEDFAV